MAAPDRTLLASLDPHKRAAATHPGGRLAIIAGAGTGKTRVLTARIGGSPPPAGRARGGVRGRLHEADDGHLVREGIASFLRSEASRSLPRRTPRRS